MNFFVVDDDECIDDKNAKLMLVVVDDLDSDDLDKDNLESDDLDIDYLESDHLESGDVESDYLESDDFDSDYLESDDLENAYLERDAYLIFVIFFTQAKFLENQIYTEKARKLRQNTQKFANFLRYYGKIHSKSVKIYTGQKKFTRIYSWRS